MSLPLRSSVWSADSEPGTAGSGICLTQTATFIRLLCSVGRESAQAPARETTILPILPPRRRNVAARPAPAAGRGSEPVPSARDGRARRRRRGGGRAGRDRGRDHGRRPAACDVVCVDKAHFPRDKTCGDGLTANALRLLEELGVSAGDLAATEPAFVRETVLVSPSGRRAHLPLPDRRRARGGRDAGARSTPRSSRVARRPRRRHPRRLRGRAREAGRRRRSSSRSPTARCSTRRFVIAADGHWSTVRRALEPDAPRDLGEWHAVRQYFDGVDDERLWVIFERDLLPGYAWVFPLRAGARTSATACCVPTAAAVASSRTSGPTCWRGRSLRDILGPERAAVGDRCTRGRSRRATNPARLDARARALRGRRGGVVDPMTGEGIAQAIETGMLAAEAIATGRRLPPLVHRALGRDLRFAQLLQTSCAARSAHAPRSAPPTSRRGRGATSPAGCGRTIRARCSRTPDRWQPRHVHRAGRRGHAPDTCRADMQ